VVASHKSSSMIRTKFLVALGLYLKAKALWREGRESRLNFASSLFPRTEGGYIELRLRDRIQEYKESKWESLDHPGQSLSL